MLEWRGLHTYFSSIQSCSIYTELDVAHDIHDIEFTSNYTFPAMPIKEMSFLTFDYKFRSLTERQNGAFVFVVIKEYEANCRHSDHDPAEAVIAFANLTEPFIFNNFRQHFQLYDITVNKTSIHIQLQFNRNSNELNFKAYYLPNGLTATDKASFFTEYKRIENDINIKKFFQVHMKIENVEDSSFSAPLYISHFRKYMIFIVAGSIFGSIIVFIAALLSIKALIAFLKNKKTKEDEYPPVADATCPEIKVIENV